MTSYEKPPSDIPSSYYTVCTALLGCGAIGYTLTYYLMTRASLRDRTYSMPLFSLAFNFGWEIVFSLFIAQEFQEKACFTVWMILDIGLVYTTVVYGPNEWKHAPIVGKHIGKILAGMVGWWCVVIYVLFTWWVDPSGPVNAKEGKFYKGIPGADIREMGFWTALVAQVVLSVAYLAQIIVRGHSRGTSYTIWATRFFGSLFGLNVFYAYVWSVWPEAHAYYINPVSVCLLVTWVVADLAYLVILRNVKRTEVVLKYGRKVRGGIAVSGKAS